MQYLAVSGLLLIAAAWMLQYYRMKKGSQELYKDFAVVYCLGALVLMLDGFSAGVYELAIMNLLTLVAALLVLSKARKK